MPPTLSFAPSVYPNSTTLTIFSQASLTILQTNFRKHKTKHLNSFLGQRNTTMYNHSCNNSNGFKYPPDNPLQLFNLTIFLNSCLLTHYPDNFAPQQITALSIPRTRTKSLFDRSFSFFAPTLWDRLSLPRPSL